VNGSGHTGFRKRQVRSKEFLACLFHCQTAKSGLTPDIHFTTWDDRLSADERSGNMKEKGTTERIDKQGLKRKLLLETAGWLNEQVENVWRAMAGGRPAAEKDKKLQVKHSGKETIYHFIYKGKLSAEARSYFNEEEQQWRFELTKVIQEYYQNVHDYFTGKIPVRHNETNECLPETEKNPDESFLI